MAKNNDQQALPFPQPPRRLDVATLESWLWEAACVIRGPLDAPKFKDYILPLIFLKRLSDVFDDELASLAHQFGDAAPGSSADWGWVQHMLAGLKPGGRMAVVLDTGAVSRGSGYQGSKARTRSLPLDGLADRVT